MKCDFRAVADGSVAQSYGQDRPAGRRAAEDSFAGGKVSGGVGQSSARRNVAYQATGKIKTRGMMSSEGRGVATPPKPTPQREGNWYVIDKKTKNNWETSFNKGNPQEHKQLQAFQCFKTYIARMGLSPKAAAASCKDMNYSSMNGRMPEGVRFMHVRLNGKGRAFFLEYTKDPNSKVSSSRGKNKALLGGGACAVPGGSGTIGVMRFIQVSPEHDCQADKVVHDLATTFRQDAEELIKNLESLEKINAKNQVSRKDIKELQQANLLTLIPASS